MSRLVYSSEKGFIPGYSLFEEFRKPTYRYVECETRDCDDDDDWEEDDDDEIYE